MSFDLIVAGVGGQGTVILAQILGAAAIRTAQAKGERVDVIVGEMYGAAMRGGAVSSHIRIGGRAPMTREDKGDVILALEALEGLRLGLKFLSPTGIVLLNTSPLPPVDVKLGRAKYPNIKEIEDILKELGNEVYLFDATELAIKATSPRSMNIVMVGALCALKKLPVDTNILLDVVAERVPPNTKEANIKAFELGMQAGGRLRPVN